MENSVIEINSFNKASQTTKAEVFLRELNRSDANKHSPYASLGNPCSFFVFVGKTALVCIKSSDARDFYFAVNSDKAEACLDEKIERYKESGWQYDNWRQTQAYIHAYFVAAETLRNEVYPPKTLSL